MPIRLLTSSEDLAAYDQWVKTHEHGSLWQSLEWKKYQESLGREVRIYAAIRDPLSASNEQTENLLATALVVIDRTSFGLSTWNIPRGPLYESENEKLKIDNFLEELLKEASKDTCISLYFSPIQSLILNSQLSILHSSRHEQPEATRILDLTLNDEELLAQMHQKGRYNINVARKNGVIVEQSTDIDSYYALAQKTGKRDAFGIPSKRQLTMFLEKLEGSFLLLAYTSYENESCESRELKNTDNSKLETHDLKPIAGLLGVTWNNRGIYYYGASDYEHRALMAPYLLQWEAMKLCKEAGCTTYDLLGIAPPSPGKNAEEMERGLGGEAHPWAGISSFKEKFGGTVVSYPPEQEITLKPMVKRLLEVKRKILG